MKVIYQKLMEITSEVKANKTEYNSFGKYKYRNLESIFQELKPILKKYECALVPNDELILIGTRYYIKATMTLYDLETGDSVSCQAFARESESKKGMDESQITGTASTYARKYAICGLFNIDDNKDADSMDNSEPTAPKYKFSKDKLIEKILDEYERTGKDIYEVYNKKKIKSLVDLADDDLQKLYSYIQKQDSKTQHIESVDEVCKDALKS